VTGYNPWAHVQDMADVLVAVDHLEHADAYWEPDERVILLDRRLTQRQRRSRLAHELAHMEAGDECCEHGPDGHRLAMRQERRANDTAARRLITIGALAEALLWACDVDELAEDLHVDEDTVRARIDGLTEDELEYIRRRFAAQDWGAA
jgi:Zn-dependent peptidase ImmA (M78 family)